MAVYLGSTKKTWREELDLVKKKTYKLKDSFLLAVFKNKSAKQSLSDIYTDEQIKMIYEIEGHFGKALKIIEELKK
jgi:hypothetical protein